MKIHTVVSVCHAGGWRPVEDGGGGEKLYIQTGSKMNDLPEVMML